MPSKRNKKDPFWNEVIIPFQEEDPEFQFANPVIVSEQFIKAVAQGARIGERSEVLVRRLKKLNSIKKDITRDLAKLKQEILAKFYSEVTKTASPDIMAAFIRRKAEEVDREDELAGLLKELDTVDAEIDDVQDQLDILKDRMKFLDKAMDWARQFLDYDKLQQRLEDNGRKTR